MRSLVVPQKLVAPKTVSIITLTLVLAGIVVEVAEYQLGKTAWEKQIYESMSNQPNSLLAIVMFAKQQHISQGALDSTLDRYCSLAKIDALIELPENDSVLYRSSHFNSPIFSNVRSMKDSLGTPAPVHVTPQSLKVISTIDGPYRFLVARSLTEAESSWYTLHSMSRLMMVTLLALLVPGGLIIFIYWYRPNRALTKHIEDLAKHPRHLPLPGVPDFSHFDTNELAHHIHTIIKDLHNSRKDALTFSSMASHEMRTPLSIIRHQLETALSSRSVDPSFQKLIASAYDEVLRLSGTVEDLLNLSTLQTGTANLNFTYFSLRDFLKAFYDEALFLTRPKDITVVLAKGPHVTIEADAVRLRQVFFNLLDNAIKYTEPKGRIHISSETQGDDILLTFSDTGRGISPQNLQKIFEPFFRDADREAPSKGAGLGLPLVRWIIENHDGSVSVESEPGKGATFLVRIPRYHSISI